MIISTKRKKMQKAPMPSQTAERGGYPIQQYQAKPKANQPQWFSVEDTAIISLLTEIRDELKKLSKKLERP